MAASSFTTLRSHHGSDCRRPGIVGRFQQPLTTSHSDRKSLLAKREGWAQDGCMKTLRKLLWAYASAGLLTLLFQIWWRSFECGDACGLSYTKAAIWSVIWPLYWPVFLRGFF